MKLYNIKNKNSLISTSSSNFLNKFNKPGLSYTLLAIPFVILIAVFSYFPLLGWILAFFEYKPGISLLEQKFIGLYNFIRLFKSGLGFWDALVNTVVLSCLGIIFTPLPALLALMINELRSSRFSRFVRSVTSLPYFISWVLAYAVATLMFSVDDGLLNLVFFKYLGILKQPTNVLADAANAWFIQTAISIWKNMGWQAIIYLAAIASIDVELYDAANIDGAGKFRKIFHITIPGIKETYVVLLLLAIAGMLSQGFEQFWVFQNPMTRSKLEVIDTYMYRMGMTDLRFDFSTAVGMFKTIVSVILLFMVNRVSKFLRGSSII